MTATQTQTAVAPEVAPLPKPEEPPPPPPLPDIKDLVGLTATDLTKYFGKPAVDRHESPAEVWHYVGPECVLHLFLYSDGKGGIPVVDHVEISERGPLLVEAAERRDGVCIQAFLKPDMEIPIKPKIASPAEPDPATPASDSATSTPPVGAPAPAAAPAPAN
jgi:hypothetical protein